MPYRPIALAALALTLLPLLAPSSADEPDATARVARPKVPGTLVLHARSRRTAEGGRAEVVEADQAWEAAETAIIICDMWDRHWCGGANRRVGVLAPRMNAVVDAARSLGVLIVHAPSETMDAFADHPARLRAQDATKAEPPAPIARWCKLDPDSEPPLPIDDSDGGCDCALPCPSFKAWSGQHPAIAIAAADAISDDGAEIYNLLTQEGIKHVVIMGVHTNMCVLGRSFGIRQLRRLGFDVALARDLTDTMYNPRMSPNVSHARGTELVVEHIEAHWCPSILSDDLTRVAPGTAGP